MVHAYRLMIDHSAFLSIAAVMYSIYNVGLWDVGLRHHATTVRGDSKSVRRYPDGYFTMLVAQLVPLTVTGFARGDIFIIATRVTTLVSVLIVFALVKNKTGTFDTWRYRAWIAFWLSVFVLCPMAWVGSEHVRNFVVYYEKLIGWSAVAMMVVFLIFGQHITAKALFKNYMSGEYGLRRFSLQIVRCVGFTAQAAHYGATDGWLDPFFLQGALGTIGTLIVITYSLWGMIKGFSERLKLA